MLALIFLCGGIMIGNFLTWHDVWANHPEVFMYSSFPWYCQGFYSVVLFVVSVLAYLLLCIADSVSKNKKKKNGN